MKVSRNVQTEDNVNTLLEEKEDVIRALMKANQNLQRKKPGADIEVSEC